MVKRTTLDLTEGPVLRKLLLFAFPLLLNSLVNNFYSTADTVMMGRFAGTNAMAAVGASNHPLGLLINLFSGLALGVNVCCGNLLGAKKQKELREAMHTCVTLSLIAGLVVAVLGVLLCEPLLRSLDTPEEILADAVLYMRIRLAAGPVQLLDAFTAQIFYAHGNTRLTMVTGLISGLINVGLNVVFVPVLGMGVEGVALATVISQVFSAAVNTAVLFAPKGAYRMTLRQFRLRVNYIKDILSVGIPNALNLLIVTVSNVLLQSAVNSFGPVLVAGNTAADNIASYVTMIQSVFASAALAASAQCYGAAHYKRIDKIMKTAIMTNALIVILLDALLSWKGTQLLMLFNDDPAVAREGFPKLMFVTWGYVIFGVSMIFASGLKGIRKATAALLCNICGMIIPRLLWVWLVIPHMHTATTLYLIYPISWAISSTVMAVLYFHYRRRLEQP